MPRPRKPASPFRYFNSSPEVIRLVVMMYVRFPLSLRYVEDLLFERGIDICHETVRLNPPPKVGHSRPQCDRPDGSVKTPQTRQPSLQVKEDGARNFERHLKFTIFRNLVQKLYCSRKPYVRGAPIKAVALRSSTLNGGILGVSEARR